MQRLVFRYHAEIIPHDIVFCLCKNTRCMVNSIVYDCFCRFTLFFRAMKKKLFNILINYSILIMCILGFASGGILALILPVFQLWLTCYHYQNNFRWQTVLWLEIHLLLSTMLGIYMLGYLYLRYISNDAESVLVLVVIWRIGAALVCGMGIIATLCKFLANKFQIER